MSRLSRIRSTHTARSAAAIGALTLTLAGFAVVEAQVGDRGVLKTRNEAPPTPGVTSETPTSSPTGVDAQARRKLAELLAQRSADLECTAMGNPQRPC